MCLLSVSNGYVASLEMMNGPSLVPDGQQSRAGTIMAFFLVLGLVVGSVSSFGVRAIACQCNPFVG
jgi:equilibrative nucleoside transporter 1/2/3